MTDRCGTCTRCRLAAADPRYGRFPCRATGRGDSSPPGPVWPCPLLGPVVNPAACGCGKKDVRVCLWDDAPWDCCTTGPNDGTVGRCSTDCPGYRAATAPAGSR